MAWGGIEEAPDYFIRIFVCFVPAVCPPPGLVTLWSPCWSLRHRMFCPMSPPVMPAPSFVTMPVTCCHVMTAQWCNYHHNMLRSHKFRSNWLSWAKLPPPSLGANVAVLWIIFTLCMKHFLQLIKPNLSVLCCIFQINTPRHIKWTKLRNGGPSKQSHVDFSRPQLESVLAQGCIRWRLSFYNWVIILLLLLFHDFLTTLLLDLWV